MTATGYVNMSVKPEAKRALELLALNLSQRWGRRVSLSEALEQAMITIYADEIEVMKPTCVSGDRCLECTRLVLENKPPKH